MRAHRNSAPPPRVRRKDYRPPAWRVPRVALDFDLDPERTIVKARLEAVRDGAHSEPLRLDGDGLKLLSLRVDGKPAAHKIDPAGLTLRVRGDSAVVETAVEIRPAASAGRTGLFELAGALCTHCEPHGFRRITYFPDRPDILSRFSVRLNADRARYPVLLSNGNPAGAGTEGGRHWAAWDDPIPKSCYLFALVAGDLAALRARFVTRSGREVDLAVWAERAALARTEHALAALERAMRWDEQVFGREYDLQAYNIVALPGYRFGAMENKGLPVYDAGAVLVEPETATDAALESAETLVAHEYFHNWSGNRIAPRDWFEMGLKEGFTVFRDQLFAAETGLGEVKRIEDVRALRAAQFVEDAGLRAHPVRPECYGDIAEFQTATVYAKGAEIVRMVRTLIGEAAFRAGSDLFFARHDGAAVTAEDFLAAMSEASGIDLAGFLRWYSEAGTPRLEARLGGGAAGPVVTLAQGTAPKPMPVRLASFDCETGALVEERCVLLQAEQAEVEIGSASGRSVLSINRGFSAPVLVELEQDVEALSLLARRETDAFARCEAMRELLLRTIAAWSQGDVAVHGPAVEAVRAALEDDALDRALLAELVALPAEAQVAERLERVDPDSLHAARGALEVELGRTLLPLWRSHWERAAPAPFQWSPAARADRRLRAAILPFLLAARATDAPRIALKLLEGADNLTDRAAALRALASCDAPERSEALGFFRARHRDDPEALDIWFAAQAGSSRADTVQAAPKLVAHADFSWSRAQRVWALAGTFAANHHALHHLSGRGYGFAGDVAAAVARLDAAMAARLAAPLLQWRRYDPARAGLIQAQLRRMLATPQLPDAFAAEIASALP